MTAVWQNEGDRFWCQAPPWSYLQGWKVDCTAASTTQPAQKSKSFSSSDARDQSWLITRMWKLSLQWNWGAEPQSNSSCQALSNRNNKDLKRNYLQSKARLAGQPGVLERAWAIEFNIPKFEINPTVESFANCVPCLLWDYFFLCKMEKLIPTGCEGRMK